MTYTVSSFLAVLVIPYAALATLGEPLSSLDSNRTALKAVKKSVTKRTAYSIHEYVSDGSTTRQYATQDGIVFALAWNGVSHPDLASLLGNYDDDYRKALRSGQRKKGQRHFAVHGSRVIVEKWGHMRNLQGRAYDPALMPNGVNINEIQ
jgi:hypothetical protein